MPTENDRAEQPVVDSDSIRDLPPKTDEAANVRGGTIEATSNVMKSGSDAAASIAANLK